MSKTRSNTITYDELFSVHPSGFESLALSVFHKQYRESSVYRKYCDLLKINPEAVDSISMIPFLPIQFFKTQVINTGSFMPELVFESSGTTGSVNSKHYVKDSELYKQSFLRSFTKNYGNVAEKCIIGLLPSYLERQHSSLVYMVNELILQSEQPTSGFYLYDTEKLYQTLLLNEHQAVPTILIGVTYALLDFAEKYPMQLKHTIVMETGGMKGRRKELTRDEVHSLLTQQLGLAEVHSEYGMTELLSQAYSHGNGIFKCAPWMQVLLRAEDDPFEIREAKKINDGVIRGAVNIIDLANIHSCSFIATDDVGKLYADGSFEISGRLENSDVRGCGLMLI